MNHTPGPWTVCRKWSNGCETCPEIFSEGIAGRSWVATVTGAPHLGFEETLHNADLIAAAPDLLAACKALHSQLRDAWENIVNIAGHDSEESKAMEPAIEQGNAAIAKAESAGQQQEGLS